MLKGQTTHCKVNLQITIYELFLVLVMDIEVLEGEVVLGEVPRILEKD